MVTIVDDHQSEWEMSALSNRNKKGSSDSDQDHSSKSSGGLGTTAAPRLSMRLPTFLLFLIATFLVGRMSVRCTRSCSSMVVGNDNILKGKCKVWIQYRSHADPKRLTLGCEKTWAAVKPMIKDALKTSTEKDSNSLMLLHPIHGKVDLNVPVGSAKFQSQTRKPLIAFFDDPETRIMLKQRTSIPVKLTSELCFRRDQKSDDAYVILYRILSNHFTKEDVNTMRRTLCQSSFEVSSWQEAPINHDRLASAYSYVFKRRG